ncbi:hypothetical protein H0E87_023776, partial [Populus deltoides]
LPNISEINRHWSCKFDGKNWRDDLPACGSKSGARMSSDSSTYSFRVHNICSRMLRYAVSV